MFDVITFGTATYDVFLRSPGMEISDSGDDKDICLRYGAKLEVNEIYFDYGGGGTNSAVTFARQGLKVAAVVQIGNDFFGNKIIEDLKKEKVDTGLINVEEGFTDYSTILWAPDGGRTILVYRGKTRLEKEDIKWENLCAKWFYISSLEGNLEIIKNLIRRFGGKNCRIVWNPGSRELKQREEVLKLLEGVTVLNLNKEEMEELLAISNPPADGAIEEFLKEAQKLPCEYVVITDDKNGAYLWDRENLTWWKSGIFEDAPRVETTGAGDSFGSGLATGFIKGLSLEDCLYLASANASSKVTQVGAKKGLLKQQDLVRWDKKKLRMERITL